MEPLATIQQLLADPQAATDASTVMAFVRRHPYYTLPAALLLRYHADELSEAETDELRTLTAIASADREATLDIADPGGTDRASFYPPPQPRDTPGTIDTIDTFLDTYGHVDKQEEELLERLIFNPVPPDYSMVLAESDTPADTPAAPAGSQDSLIDSFIKANPPEQPRSDRPAAASGPAEPAEPADAADTRHSQPQAAPDDSLLSESLAKIFIRQQRYDRAYEIIYNLSLKYPKKSIYFADQLRFLRKLMATRRLSTADNGARKPQHPSSTNNDNKQ